MPRQDLTDDEFIRQMTVGTPPTNQAPSESFIGKKLTELGISPADFLLMAGKVPSSIGLALTPTPAGAGEEEELARLRGLAAQDTATTEGGAAKALLQAVKSKNPAAAVKAVSEVSKGDRESNLAEFLKGSKVSGPMYHITPKDFDKFIPGGNNPELSGPGIWMTPNKEFQPAAHNVYDRSGEFLSGTNVMPLYASIKNPLITKMSSWKEDFKPFGGGDPWSFTKDQAKKIQEAGYDEILLYDNKGTLEEAIAFKPNQIKSALGNEGTYDPKNPVITKAEGGEVTEEERRKNLVIDARVGEINDQLAELLLNYRSTGKGADQIAALTGIPATDISRMFGASDTSLPSAELAQESRLGEFRETTPKVMTDEGTRLRPNYELRSVPKDLTAPIGKESLEDYIRRYNIQRSGVNPRAQMFANGGEVATDKFIRRRANGSLPEGEVTNEDFIQQMMTGTPPTDQEPDRNVPKDIVRGIQYTPFDVLGAPVDIATMVMRPFGYDVEKPVGGSDWFIEQAAKRGLAQPSTGSGAELLGRIAGGVTTPAAAKGVGKVAAKTEDFISGQLDTAAKRVEENTLAKLRQQTGNPNLTASQLYNAMLGKQAPGAAITKPMGPTTAPVQAPQTPLGFYSAVEDTILKLPQEKGTAQQLLAQISKAPGVKTKEVEATGLAEFLKSKGTAPVTKQEIQDFLANNRVQVDEVVLGKGQVMSPEAKQRMGAAENRMIEIDNQLALYFENLRRPDIDSYGTFVRLRGPVARKAAAGDAEAMAEIDALNLPSNIKQLLLEFGEQKNEYQKYAKQSRKMEKPRFDQYNIPGGENAREIYLTLPSLLKRAMSEAEIDRLDELARKRIESSLDGLSPAEQSEYFSLISKRERVGAAFTAPRSHSVSPEADTNRLAHIFLDDRTDTQGNKTLFVQELQSDWAQQGRDSGFKSPPDPVVLEAAKNKVSQTEQALRQKFEDLFNRGERAQDHPERLAALEQVTQAREELQTLLQESRLPPAPFVTNTEDWLNLALKRVIKEAVDSGADNVAFIKGEQAADKYSLRRVADEIRYGDDGYLVAMKDGAILSSRKVPKEELPDHVGKEVADRLLNNPTETTGSGYAVVSGVDLQVGGEGMKGFYDNIVPKTANKLLEKLGSKIETIDLGRTKSRETWVQGRENPFRAEQDINEPFEGRVKIVNTETGESRMFNTRDEADEYVAEALGHNVDQIHLGFKITPEMREIVKGQGLPQFAAGGEVTNFIRAHA
jgi:hypothetical protein